MIAIGVIGLVCLVVASSWLTVAHWVREHSATTGEDRPSLVLIQGGRTYRS